MPKPPRRRPSSAPRAKSVLFTARQRELATKRRGELAELAFTLKAATHGFGVAKPFGDSERYDVIVDSRRLLPVRKTARVAAGASRACPGRSRRVKRSVASAGITTLRKPSAESRKPIPPLWRIQIKCSTQVLNGLYRVNAHRRTGGRAVPYLPGEIDFLAAYIIPEDTWYILPLEAFVGSTSLLFRRRADRKPGLYDAYREAWHLLRPK